jgi:hypothetical protein
MKRLTKIKSFESYVNEQKFMDSEGKEAKFQPGDKVMVDGREGEVKDVNFKDGVTKYKVIIKDSDPERAKQGYQTSGTYSEEDLKKA